jgi:signal peptidase I
VRKVLKTYTSMKPTLEMGERFIATKIGENREFQRGDIVIFEYTSIPDVVFVKRIIGLPGDLLSISEDTLRINRSILHEPYVCFEKNGTQIPQDARNLSERTIPAGHVYVLSDNRYNGVDSRQYGPVSIDSIHGLALYVYLSNSTHRIGFNLRRGDL